MPYKKRHASRKTHRRSARSHRRTRIHRPLNQNSVSIFTRCETRQLVAGSNIVTFSLSALPDYSDFQLLFDQYRIVKIDVMLHPQANFLNYAGMGTLSALPIMYYSFDADGPLGTPTQSELLEKQGVKFKQMTKPFTLHIKPRVLTGLTDGTGAVVSAGVKYAPWIDCSDSMIQHFGFKYYMANLNGSPSLDITMICRYYIECKGVQ